MEELNISLVRELALLDMGNLRLIFGREALVIHQRALGIDPTPLKGCRYSLLLDKAKELAVERNVEEKVVSDLIFSVFDKYDFDALSRWKLREGAKELLDWLKTRGHFLALVTNVGERAMDEALRKFGLKGYFEVVITRDSGFPMKPRPQGLRYIFEVSGLPTGRVLFIGDSLDDLRAAKAAGLKVIIITGGEDDQRAIRRYRPDFMVSNFHQIKDLIVGLIE
ncbi:hypothetical protein DRO38_06520 [Candidatus Bathyarchaeota archaeon]|nr:MAG: hypothetical protein DRO38_06520 [Candidatus Bathyarchaeota archaeon]